MRRLRGWWVLAALLAALPLAFPGNYYVTVVGTAAGLHAILAVGLNLLMGYAGQISLGHAAFFGLGAYASAILTTRLGWSPWLALGLGQLLTGLVAYVIARPVLRLKGHYLAMATLGFGIIVNILLVQTGKLTGGPDGIREIPALSLFGWAIDSDERWYVVVAATLLLVVLLTLNLIDSRTGRALRALHGSEVAAAMMSIDTAAAKTAVFVLAALTAGLAGSLFAHQQAFVSPDSFNFFVSIELVTMVVLGGLASTWGAILGAVILTLLPELLVVFEDYEVIIFGAILMLIMIFLPQGLVGGLHDLWQRWGPRGDLALEAGPTIKAKRNPARRAPAQGEEKPVAAQRHLAQAAEPSGAAQRDLAQPDQSPRDSAQAAPAQSRLVQNEPAPGESAPPDPVSPHVA